MKLRQLLRESARKLTRARVSFGHGTTNARDEAAWLALHALNLEFDALDDALDRALAPDEESRVRALIDDRIATRKPAAYLTHEAWLGEHRFYVDERVLVPRSFIAELLREDLAPWVTQANRVRSVLDLCTGCACLAILAALSFPRAAVHATDVSRDALDVARRNIAAYRLGRRVKTARSDLYAGLADRRYDLILSNPPYVTGAAMRRLPAEYRNEPALALAGGEDGLRLVRTIIDEAPQHLEEKGLLVLEVGHNRSGVERAYPSVPFVWAETSGGDDCVLLITREALVRSLSRPARSPRARQAGLSPRRRAAR
jgi:ribosomal protein L3 glutamine methyltransferase